MADYSCKKFSLTTYRLTTMHPLQTTADDNRTISWTITEVRSGTEVDCIWLHILRFLCMS